MCVAVCVSLPSERVGEEVRQHAFMCVSRLGRRTCVRGGAPIPLYGGCALLPQTEPHPSDAHNQPTKQVFFHPINGLLSSPSSSTFSALRTVVDHGTVSVAFTRTCREVCVVM